jgi:hypothetical protein
MPEEGEPDQQERAADKVADVDSVRPRERDHHDVPRVVILDRYPEAGEDE